MSFQSIVLITVGCLTFDNRLDELTVSGAAFIALQTAAAEAHIHAVGLLSESNVSDAESIQSLHSCIKCIKTVFDVFFDIPLRDVPGLPFYVFVTVACVQIMLYRLTTTENVIWNKAFLHSTVDVITVADRAIQLFEHVGQLYPSQDQGMPDNFFHSAASLMRGLRSAWLPAVTRQYQSHPAPNISQNIEDTTRQATATLSDGTIPTCQLLTDGDNDHWITDVFELWSR